MSSPPARRPRWKCAACKFYSKKECKPDCPFAPYFPPNDPRRFVVVHTVFHARNVVDFLNAIPQEQRRDAADYLVNQANSRSGKPAEVTAKDLKDMFEAHRRRLARDPASEVAPPSRAALEVVSSSSAAPENAANMLVKIPRAHPGQTLAARKPCVVCQTKRHGCKPDCMFATYFPPGDDPKRFAAVKRLFGVKNFTRILRQVPPHQRWVAAKTMVYEALAFVDDPVHGLRSVIRSIENELQDAFVELFLLEDKLRRYTGAAAAQARTRAPYVVPQMQPRPTVVDAPQWQQAMMARQAVTDAHARPTGTSSSATTAPAQPHLLTVAPYTGQQAAWAQQLGVVVEADAQAAPGGSYGWPLLLPPGSAEAAPPIIQQQPPSQEHTATVDVRDPSLPKPDEQGGDQ